MLTPNDDGLLPCFHCGTLTAIRGSWFSRRLDPQIAFSCQTCRTSGPRSRDGEKARDGWNRIQRALELWENTEASVDAAFDGGEPAWGDE